MRLPLATVLFAVLVVDTVAVASSPCALGRLGAEHRLPLRRVLADTYDLTPRPEEDLAVRDRRCRHRD